MSAFLVDTSFLIALVDDRRPHHADAMRYLREAVSRGSTLYLSAVVRGRLPSSPGNWRLQAAAR